MGNQPCGGWDLLLMGDGGGDSPTCQSDWRPMLYTGSWWDHTLPTCYCLGPCQCVLRGILKILQTWFWVDMSPGGHFV